MSDEIKRLRDEHDSLQMFLNPEKRYLTGCLSRAIDDAEEAITELELSIVDVKIERNILSEELAKALAERDQARRERDAAIDRLATERLTAAKKEYSMGIISPPSGCTNPDCGLHPLHEGCCSAQWPVGSARNPVTLSSTLEERCLDEDCRCPEDGTWCAACRQSGCTILKHKPMVCVNRKKE